MRTLAFDLDDTLYDELDYVRSGMAWVAARFARDLGRSEPEIVALFDSLLAAGGRKQIFDRALLELGLDPDSDLIDAMVTCYRSQQPDIALYPGVESVIEELMGSYRLVLVTDGLSMMQRSKVAALDIERWFDNIVYCWDHQVPKPDSAGYRLAIGEESLPDAIIIGDNPVNDGLPARELNIPFIRIKSRRFSDLPGGDLVLKSIAELPEALKRV